MTAGSQNSAALVNEGRFRIHIYQQVFMQRSKLIKSGFKPRKEITRIKNRIADEL